MCLLSVREVPWQNGRAVSTSCEYLILGGDNGVQIRVIKKEVLGTD